MKGERSASNCWCVANWRTFMPHPNCPIHAGGDRCQICHDEECDGVHDEYEAEQEAPDPNWRAIKGDLARGIDWLDRKLDDMQTRFKGACEAGADLTYAIDRFYEHGDREALKVALTEYRAREAGNFHCATCGSKRVTQR